MARENLSSEMIIRKNKIKLYRNHGARIEYQRLNRLGWAEGRERKVQFGSMILCSLI